MCLRCSSPIDYGKVPVYGIESVERESVCERERERVCARERREKKWIKNNKINFPRLTKIVLVVLSNGYS